jgi:peptidoglycan/LPS O-acetylase OafA/YrhL
MSIPPVHWGEPPGGRHRTRGDLISSTHTTLPHPRSAQSSGSDAELPALTSLRFLAAALVFLHHFPPPAGSWLEPIVAAQGHVGVTVFFVLSGFLITVRYSEALAGGPAGATLNEYFRKRVARIVPLYWTVLALSLFLATGRVEVSWATLPEWLLLQGFLSRSVRDLAVPTSWTLTLEECFYALAPLVFMGVRRARAHGALVLLAWTAALLAVGFGLSSVVDAERFQFLGSPVELMRHTFFGRFVDFAVGVWAGRVFLGGGVGRLWSRPRGDLAATAVGGLGFALVFAGQAGMTLAGGLEGPRWAVAWSFNLVVAAGSLVAILALTSRTSPLSRALGLRPLVYLGRVSYALYLIQLTPLGKGLLYRVLPQGTPAFGLALYAGMTIVSALLFEWVEEPMRRLILRLWPVRGRPGPAPAAKRVRPSPAWALVAMVVAAVSVQVGAWAGSRLDDRHPATLSEARTVASSLPDRMVALPSGSLVSRPTAEGWRHRVPIPDSWMVGTSSDRRAPPSLLVFVDGEPVPFERRVEDLESARTGAHYRGPRSTFVEVLLPAESNPSELTLVRHDPAFAAALLARRLASSPWLLALVACVLAAAASSARWFHARLRPRLGSVAPIAACVATLYCLAGLHEQSWALALILAELAILCGLALTRPAPVLAERAASGSG